ncbi:hypothetical protein I204_02290 [Kwoniella mangroviensis CBS 8886]|nr:hypothetical protein I204_02290 [Kwoniella mangroviensis CBS 8886]
MPRSESSTPSSLSLIRSSRARSNPYPKIQPKTKPSPKKQGDTSQKVKQEYFDDKEDRTSDLVPSSSPFPSPISSTQEGDDELVSEFGLGMDEEKPTFSDSDFESTRPKKKFKTKPKSGSPKRSSNGGTPRKNGGVGRAWTGEEDWRLFRELHPKVGKPDWMGVANKVGNGRGSKVSLCLHLQQFNPYYLFSTLSTSWSEMGLKLFEKCA